MAATACPVSPRSFFFAGARALLVTHWDLSDTVAPVLIDGTLARLKENPGEGIAGSLRYVQMALVDRAGATLPAVLAHPAFWASFAVIGEGGPLGVRSASVP